MFMQKMARQILPTETKIMLKKVKRDFGRNVKG